ncbi:MAG: polysaccharide biosynthesis/export family protein [Phycisphaerales bacterium]|nr:polysaccharide biosynthesis/export family protein [Phycisphaerales bacterium]
MRRSIRGAQWPATFRRWFGIPLLGGLILAGGCTSTHDQSVAFVRSDEAEVAVGTYIVRAPDALLIHAPGAPEIDGAIYGVRPDGKIVLRLLGEVDVAGLSTEQISAKLRAQLSRYYVEPEVAVAVANYRSQYYYVFGEVTSPGPRICTGRDSLLLALADAQPNFFAWRSQIRVVRPSPDGGERRVLIIDMDKMVDAGNTEQDMLLQPGDIIHVPPTPLAWVGHRVRELLYPVQPVLDAYNAPAQGIDSTRTYESEFGSGGSSGGGTRRRFSP